jgi:hypothetical protein
VAETRASTENLKRDSPSGYSGVIGASSMPLHKRKKGALIHDENGTSSRLAQCPGCVTASGETRRIPRVPPLSFCGTPQGGGPGRPHQTVARPFAKLNRPLRGATCERAGLGFVLGELGYKSGCQFARYWSRKPILRQVLEMVAGVRFELITRPIDSVRLTWCFKVLSSFPNLSPENPTE